MNLKSLMTGAAIAATVVSASVVAIAPAQAASLSLAGTGRLEVGATTSTLNFFSFGDTVNGNAAELPLFTPVGVKDILLNNVNPTTWSLSPSSVASFLTGTSLGNFTLTKFDLTKTNGTFGPNFIANFEGFFNDGSSGVGDFRSAATVGSNLLLSSGGGYAIALDSTPVPTPALLPGLVGLGVAALRKRKGEGAEKETVGVKA
jgi:hypothetical protein